MSLNDEEILSLANVADWNAVLNALKQVDRDGGNNNNSADSTSFSSSLLSSLSSSLSSSSMPGGGGYLGDGERIDDPREGGDSSNQHQQQQHHHQQQHHLRRPAPSERSYLLAPAELSLTANSRAEVHSLIHQNPINHKERQELTPLPSTYLRQPGAFMGQDGRQTSGRINSGIPQKVPPVSSTKFHDFRKSLPIWGMRNQIIQSVWTNQVIVIAGASGSGKSTQVPQFIMETCEGRDEACRIICTQPRRLMAMTVSERIALERGESVGQSIGYQVRLESKLSPRTITTMCTYRVLLRTLMGSEESQVAHITHIIMDEIHERNKISDFLLIELRALLVKHSHLRLVLMSSSVSAAEEYQAYFFGKCPLLDIPSRVHPVEEFFLEDVLEKTRYSTDRMKKLERSQSSNAAYSVKEELAGNGAEKQRRKMDPQLARDMDQIINNILEEDLDNEDNFDQLFCLILSDNVSVDYAHSHSGVTPLMAVCKAGHLPSVQRLLRLGASIMLKTKVTEKTAFDFAQGAEKDDVVEMLQGFLENDRLTPIAGNTLLREKNEMNSTSHNDSNNDDEAAAAAQDTEHRLGAYHACFDDDSVDIDLLVVLVEYVLDHDKTSGAVLVFLPGYDEIIQASDALDVRPAIAGLKAKNKVDIICLHSKLQPADLQQAYDSSPPGHRKIILATDIAETSVTVDDVTIVIDSGKCRERPLYESCCSSAASLLYKSSNWVSRVNADFRLSRAGRVVSGSCYRLFSRSRFASFAEVVVPEIQKDPLEELCLHAKVIAEPNVTISKYLSRAPNPPSPAAIQNAIDAMKNIDALDKDEELTELGHHLADLPLPPHLGKMVLYSIILRCVDPVLTIASALAYRDPFVVPLHPSQKRLAARARIDLADRTFSDHVALLRVFQEWNRTTERDRTFLRGTDMEVKFCERYFVSSSTMRVIFDIRTKLLQELRALKFIQSRGGGGDMRDLNNNSERWPMVKGALCAGLYPNLLRVDRARGEAVQPKEGKIRFHSSSILYRPPTSAEGGGGSGSGSGGNTIDDAHQRTVAALPTDWLLYERVGKSSLRHATLKCCTAVSAITVGLFAGNTRHLSTDDDDAAAIAAPFGQMKVKVKDKYKLKIDDWISFSMDYEDLHLLHCLRVKFNALLMRRMRQPAKGWTNLDQNVLSTVERLLCTEEDFTGLLQPTGIGQRPRQMQMDFISPRNQPKLPAVAAVAAQQQQQQHNGAYGSRPDFRSQPKSHFHTGGGYFHAASAALNGHAAIPPNFFPAGPPVVRRGKTNGVIFGDHGVPGGPGGSAGGVGSGVPFYPSSDAVSRAAPGAFGDPGARRGNAAVFDPFVVSSRPPPVAAHASSAAHYTTVPHSSASQDAVVVKARPHSKSFGGGGGSGGGGDHHSFGRHSSSSSSSIENVANKRESKVAFFVVKPRDSEVFNYAKTKSVWATGTITERKLCRAFNAGKSVFLVFSFPVTQKFLGVARMTSPPTRTDQHLSQFFGPNCGGCFTIEWVSWKDVFFNECNNLLNPWNEGKQVKISREGQEIEPGVGERLLSLFTSGV